MGLEKYKYTPYSVSKIQSHQQCPRKFKYQYIDKVPIQSVPKKHFDKGKFIHLLFEYDGDISKIKDTKDFQEIKKNKLLSKDDLKEYINIYKTFKVQNESLFKRKVLWKELPIGITEDFKNADYWDYGTLFRGFVDAAFLDEEKNVLILTDWKTGKAKEKEHQSWQQLLFYAVVLFGKVPVTKLDTIIVMYAYVEHNKKNILVLKRENLDEYKKALIDSIQKIENDTTFEKHESALCNYCDFQEHCMNDA